MDPLIDENGFSPGLDIPLACRWKNDHHNENEGPQLTSW